LRSSRMKASGRSKLQASMPHTFTPWSSSQSVLSGPSRAGRS
jgi:hypothetical protein